MEREFTEFSGVGLSCPDDHCAYDPSADCRMDGIDREEKKRLKKELEEKKRLEKWTLE